MRKSQSDASITWILLCCVYKHFFLKDVWFAAGLANQISDLQSAKSHHILLFMTHIIDRGIRMMDQLIFETQATEFYDWNSIKVLYD